MRTRTHSLLLSQFYKFLLRSNAFESATQFTDQYSAAFYPDPDTDYANGDQV